MITELTDRIVKLELNSAKVSSLNFSSFLSGPIGTPVTSSRVGADTGSGPMDVAVSGDQSWSMVAGRDRVADMRSVIEKTVKNINRKNLNVVVSNIKDTGSERDDTVEFFTLCDNFLNMKPSVVKIVRIGRSSDAVGPSSHSRGAARPRLLLVTLSSEAEVTHIMRTAKCLRDASDILVRKNVFINKDMTKADAKELYEKRVARRSNQPALSQSGLSSGSLSTLSKDAQVFTPHSSGANVVHTQDLGSGLVRDAVTDGGVGGLSRHAGSADVTIAGGSAGGRPVNGPIIVHP